LLVQFASASSAAGGLARWYPFLRSPPLTAPGWIFGEVRTILDALLGLSAWLVWRRFDAWRPSSRPALRLWGWQIALIAVWPATFFGLHSLAASMFVMLALLAISAATLVAFLRRSTAAGALLLPSAVWLCYAAYLNAGFWWLNSGFG
jgi:translocator protein